MARPKKYNTLGRPRKLFGIRQNEGSIQVLRNGVYAGNTSLSDLYEFVAAKKHFGTDRVMVQIRLLKEEAQKGGSRTNGA